MWEGASSGTMAGLPSFFEWIFVSQAHCDNCSGEKDAISPLNLLCQDNLFANGKES